MSGHLDGPPPGPPDPPYIEGDLGAPSAEEFVHKRRSARAMSTTPDERLREAAEALSIIYVMLMGAEPIWAEMPVEERCARAANEAQQAFLSLDAALAAADREAPDGGR